SFSCDANGNLTSDGITSFARNVRSQLIGLTGGTSATFAYDGFGRRERKTVSGTSTEVLYDGINFVQELATTTPKASLLPALNLDYFFTRTDAFGSLFFLFVGLSSPLAPTSHAGTLKPKNTYGPFGTATSTGQTSSNAQHFTGRKSDGIGLY